MCDEFKLSIKTKVFSAESNALLLKKELTFVIIIESIIESMVTRYCFLLLILQFWMELLNFFLAAIRESMSFILYVSLIDDIISESEQ